MGKIAFVFSGQGAQYSGMGQSLYENSAAAKALYDAAEIIRPGTMQQSFHGSAEELKQTKNTQPCLYLVDLAAAAALKEKGIKPDCVAGFSLGEIAALAFGGAYSYTDGFKIVEKRGNFMQQASEEFDTGMIAVVKSSAEIVEQVCSEFDHVYPVNYNSAAQTVVAGLKSELVAFKEKMSAYPCRCIDLAVGGGFHSPFMAKASREFAEAIKDYAIDLPKLKIYANATAKPYDGDTRALLAKQIISPVQWQKTIESMIADGVDTFIEVGAGKTLCGLIKKISSEVKVCNVQDNESLLLAVEAVKENA